MIKKAAAYLTILICLLVLAVSTSKKAMQLISAKREQAPETAWWAPHRSADVGDLARMGYLEGLPEFRDTNIVHYERPGKSNGTINLYLLGDSYVMDIPDTAFYGLQSYHFGRRDYMHLLYGNLDTAATNILLIEISERFFRQFFEEAGSIYFQVKKQEENTAAIGKKGRPTIVQAGFSPLSVDSLFNPLINQNIEYNVFTYNFLNGIRQMKAATTARMFHRGSGNVVISDNGQFLFIKESVTPRGKASSYDTITAAEIDRYATTMNEIYTHYRQEGFDEVYLSIIPNPATLLQPALYNNLIPRLQHNGHRVKLAMPFIDVYALFRVQPEQYYLRGDTHWTMKGRQKWLREVNAMLKHWDSKPR